MALKHLVFAALLSAMAAPVMAGPSLDLKDAPSGHYALDPEHTSVIARVSHLGLSNFTMRFMDVSGSLDLADDQVEASPLSIDVVVASVATGSKTLDSALQGDGWFGARKNPHMTFVARELDIGNGHQGVLTGDLTLRGVTRPIELAVTYNGYDRFLVVEQRLGFSAHGIIRRRDFGMTAFEGPVGDEVELIIESEFVRKGATAKAVPVSVPVSLPAPTG